MKTISSDGNIDIEVPTCDSLNISLKEQNKEEDIQNPRNRSYLSFVSAECYIS